MHGALAGVVNQIIDNLPAHVRLKQRTALKIVRVQVIHDQDFMHMIVNQAAFAVLAFSVAGIGQAFGQQITAECNAARRRIARLFKCGGAGRKTRAGRG